MHLIALAVAHLSLPVPPEIGLLLMRASARQVLDQVLGQPPVGIGRALSHLPDAVLSRENYQRLVDLLVHPQAAKVLHHADQIDDTAIRVLTDLPQKLRKPLAFALADWPRKLNGLIDSLQFLVSRGVGSNVDELVAELATVTAWPNWLGWSSSGSACCLYRKRCRQPRSAMLDAWIGSIRSVRWAGRGGIASLLMAALSMLALAPSTFGVCGTICCLPDQSAWPVGLAPG
jgi:hypothetical protein